jgi:hypothetical protein
MQNIFYITKTALKFVEEILEEFISKEDEQKHPRRTQMNCPRCGKEISDDATTANKEKYCLHFD